MRLKVASDKGRKATSVTVRNPARMSATVLAFGMLRLPAGTRRAQDGNVASSRRGDARSHGEVTLGAKGAGEIGVTGIVAAIANAVYHATGRRIRTLPITTEALLL